MVLVFGKLGSECVGHEKNTVFLKETSTGSFYYKGEPLLLIQSAELGQV